MSLAWEAHPACEVARDSAGLRYRVAAIRGGRWSASVSAPQRGILRVDACPTRVDTRAACALWAEDVADAVAQAPLFVDLGEVALGEVVRRSRPARPTPAPAPAAIEAVDPRQEALPW